jgi:anaerobic ribonucleoside-triphosphate reductase
VQQTLEGLAVSVMPRVRTTDGHLLDWDREAIAKQLLKETKLSEQFYKEPGITEEEAQDIAKEVERRVRWMNVQYLSGPLVREIMNVVLLERHHTEWRNICTRVGTPVYDAHLIDIGTGFESKENANLQENAETSHKKKADKISKEQYLLLLPPYLADRHLAGDLHIHDLEYFGTRPFCMDWDLRYFLYYGLMPDGLGTKASVAGPAKKPEVAILHAVKALGSAQTNFAGGQGFYNFLTFIAPYFEKRNYVEIVQLMQMFVYEMTQMMVARGGQLVFSSVQLTPGVPKLWRDKPAVYAGRVWNGSSHDAPLKTYGQFEREVRLAFKALMEVMLAGDYWGKPFNFPKPEISIEPDFMKEDEAFNAANPDLPTYQELYLLTFKLAAEYGTPYFDNQLPAYRGAGEGISCYQCLAKDELVPFVGVSGELQIKQIDELFEIAAKNGLDTDLNGVQFAKLNAKTPSVNFDTHKASLKAFRGVMRQRYHGKLLEITLTTGRRIRVTPDHPVFALENGSFAKKQAKELDVGEFLPVLKNANVSTALKSYLDVNKTLTKAGYASEILSNETEVNIKNAKNRGLLKQIPIIEELIKSIEEEDYDGYVYDLVDVSETHNFCNALGVVTGNCCAYQFAATYDSDSQFEDKLYFKDGKHFSMGSWQVVSLNCPRAAYLARGDDELLFEYLRELMDTSVEIFKVKREWMNQIIKNHRMPFATQQPKDPRTGEKGFVAVGLEGLVYTIGVVGVNEMVQFHTGKQMHESREAWKLAVRAMTEMEIYAKKLSLQHGMTIALARTPAETTAQRFAVSDLIHEEFRDYAEKVVKGDLDAVKKNVQKTRDLPVYYTNGTHLPPGADVTIFERAKLEHVFFPIVDGGNIFHIFMGEATPDPQGLMDFGMRLAKETQIGYFTFSRDMTVCLGCSQVSGGLEDKCPKCGSEDVDHISRITGYLQAVSGWNSAKRQELKDRKRYNELA